jgi:hypothetical protein
MLGVPLGSDEFVANLVEGKLLKTTASVMSKLMEFEDPQAAMYLLRLSYGIVRANHFMRTTPLPQWSQVAAKFDDRVRDTVVGANNAIRQPQKVHGSLGVLELHQLGHTSGGLEQLALHKIGHELVRTKGHTQHLDLRRRDQLDQGARQGALSVEP